MIKLDIYALKIPFRISSDEFNQWMLLISKEKQERVMKFRKQEDAYRSVLADILIRTAIYRTYNIPIEEISYAYNSYGKPFLQGYSHIHFNVSHSGDWVIGALSNSMVGIDIEKIEPLEIEIAKSVFSTLEYDDFITKKREEQLSYFYDLWTLKECYVKVVGQGLSISLQSFSIRKNEEGIKLLQKNILVDPFFKQYSLDSQYKVSVCSLLNQFPKEIIIEEYASFRREFLA